MLKNCTLTGNVGHGAGAIHVSGTGSAGTRLTLEHCTLTGNSGFRGGAVSVSGRLTMLHSTIAGNTAIGASGGGVVFLGVFFDLQNSIVAGNSAPKLPRSADIINSGTITHIGVNLFQTPPDSVGGLGTETGPAPIIAPPYLAPLGDYGGPTMTMPPLPGSLAISAASGSEATEDQRGFSVVGVPDIGAAEYQGRSDLTRFWNLDFDHDGKPFGVEYALGTDALVGDAGHPRNPRVTRNAEGKPEIDFGFNGSATLLTVWIVRRSLDLSDFTEIYRYNGPTLTEARGPGINSVYAQGGIRVIDQTPPPGDAFYRFEAVLVP